MKVRFYCDIPTEGIRFSNAYPWYFFASSGPSSLAPGNTRVAFDVDLPSSLVKPMHDELVAASPPVMVESRGEA